MPKWRNWQTRTFEGRVRQLVGVRVPPSANPLLSGICSSFVHCVYLRFVVQNLYFQRFMVFLIDAVSRNRMVVAYW